MDWQTTITHKSFITQLVYEPSRIEKGFRILAREFAFGHGRLDILGRDAAGCFCIVEVKTTKSELSFGKKQAENYRQQLLFLLSYVGINVPVRVLVKTPIATVDLGIKISEIVYPKTRSEVLNVPTCRDLYGLKIAGVINAES